MHQKDRESELIQRIGTSVPIRSSFSSDSDSMQSLQSFTVRLREIIGNEPLRSFGNRCGVSAGALHHYLNIGSEPSLSRLVAIANAAGVNLLWLATGEGPMRPGMEVNDKSAYYGAPQPILDLDRLTEALEIVETEAPLKSAAWRARMAVAIYDLGEDTARDKKAALVRAAL